MRSSLLITLVSLLFFTGCVHEIDIAPNQDKLVKVRPVSIHKNVAYYIPQNLYNQKVETPSGNNDTLRYQPYQQTEAALKKVLENIFDSVHKVSDPKERLTNIDYIFVPHIETISSSNSNVDWEPTRFNMILQVSVYDKKKKKLLTTYAVGKGVANFGRYQSEPTYAVEIATRSAFLQFQDEIITKRATFK